MKKFFYLAVMLCFIQVGMTKAQTSVSSKNTDKQKQEMISNQKNPGILTTNDAKPESRKNVTPTGTCTQSKENPTCCQKKGGSTGCSQMSNTSNTAPVKNDGKKVNSQKDASVKQNLGSTPK